MIPRVLVPLDGSELAESVLPYVRAVARSFPARVLLFRCLVPDAGAREARSHVAWRTDRAEAESYLDEMAGNLWDEGIPAEWRLLYGRPSEEIVEAVRIWDADAIVLASHGTGGASPFPMGGTAYKVLSSAAASVLLVRSSPPDPPTKIARILVPVDGSPRGDWAVCLAASLARAEDAELLLLHVVSRPELLAARSDAGDSAAAEIVEQNRRAAHRHLFTLERQVSGPDVRVRTRVAVAGSVPRTIVEIAGEEEASLVVCSAHGHAATGSWPYGSVASTLLTHPPAPILVFQDLPDRRLRAAPQPALRARAPTPRSPWPTT